MNKADFITVLQNKTDLTKSEAESIVCLFCNLYRAIFKFVADTRKMSFRYSFLCGMASDTADAMKLRIPSGFKFLKIKMEEYIKNIIKLTISKFETISLGLVNCQIPWPTVKEWKSGGYAHFTSNNTNHTPDGIQKPVNKSGSSPRNYRFLNAAKN